MPISDAITETLQEVQQSPTPLPSGGGQYTVTTNDPEVGVQQLAQQESDFYNETYRPIIRDLVGETDSTQLIDTAKENADAGYEDAQQRGLRMRQRYGVYGNAAQKDKQAYKQNVSKGLNYDFQVNKARNDQFEHNYGLRQNLTQIGRGIAVDAMGDMSVAAQLRNNRENTNASLDAQQDASNTATNASLATAAIYIASMIW